MTAKYNSKYGIITGLVLAWQAASYFSPNTEDDLKYLYLISIFLSLFLTIRFLYLPYFKVTQTRIILYNMIFINNITLSLNSVIKFSVEDDRLYYQHTDGNKRLLIRKSSCMNDDWELLINRVFK